MLKLHQVVDTEVNALVDNFGQLVRASRIGDTVRNSQELLQIDVYASRIVCPGSLSTNTGNSQAQAGEAILALTSELKRAALLSNFQSINEAVRERVRVFDRHTTARADALQVVSTEVETVLRQLEEHYYASASRPVHCAAPTAELSERMQDLERAYKAAPYAESLRGEVNRSGPLAGPA